MEDVYGKAYSDIIYRAKSVTKISKTVTVVKVIYYALNKISFFVNNLKATNALTRAIIKININNNSFIKFRPSFN